MTLTVAELQPLDAEPVPESGGERSVVLLLDPSLAGMRILVLAGPGVVRTYSHVGLRDLSRAAGYLSAKSANRWNSDSN